MVFFFFFFANLFVQARIFTSCVPPPFFCLFSVFEEPEDPSNRSFFSEIISSISDVKFSHSGRYMMTRDYLSVKIWDLNMENRPVETYQVFAIFSFQRVCNPFIYFQIFIEKDFALYVNPGTVCIRLEAFSFRDPGVCCFSLC